MEQENETTNDQDLTEPTDNADEENTSPGKVKKTAKAGTKSKEPVSHKLKAKDNKKKQKQQKQLFFENQTRLSIEKQNVFNVVEQEQNRLNDIGHFVWRYAELAGVELQSAKTIVDYLENKGFRTVDMMSGRNFNTAFRLEFKKTHDPTVKQRPNIAFLCEYSADPKTGHSYGHNLVTATCLAAAIGLQRVIGFSKKPMGKVTVIGCSQNSSKTAKKELLEAGFFKHLDYIFTAYPAHFTCLKPRFLNSKKLRVKFTGRSVLSGVEIWETANPLSAVVLAMHNLGAHRQNFLPGWAINTVIPHAGDDPCVQPESAVCLFELRSPDPLGINVLNEKLHQCLDGASTASGCIYEETIVGTPMISNAVCTKFVDLYRKNAKLNGFTFHDEVDDILLEPEDISFVSQRIPTFKIFYYAGVSAKRGSDEFNRFCGSNEAEYMNVVQGKSLAMMAVDFMKEHELMTNINEEHKLAQFKHNGSISDSSTTTSSEHTPHSVIIRDVETTALN